MEIKIFPAPHRKIYKSGSHYCVMSKGLSPIIATMILIAIAISLGAVASIWLRSQTQEYMMKEGERRDRILDKEGESLALIHVMYDDEVVVDPDTGLELDLQNNGTSDLDVAYVKLNQYYFRQNELDCYPDCGIEIDSSRKITIPLASLPGAIDGIEKIGSIEIGTVLGNLFIYNAPAPQIRITNTFIDANNKLYTFSGEGSVDDGQIVKWLWCFDYDDATGDDCECMPGETCTAADCSDPYRACGNGIVTTYNYKDYATGTYYIWLTVTDDTGMVGVIIVQIDIP